MLSMSNANKRNDSASSDLYNSGDYDKIECH